MVRKFSSELWFEPKPPRTELRVQFKVRQKLLNRTLGPVQGSTKSSLVWTSSNHMVSGQENLVELNKFWLSKIAIDLIDHGIYF